VVGLALNAKLQAAFTGRHWNTSVPMQASMKTVKNDIQAIINR
jgi:hypothetical protein